MRLWTPAYQKVGKEYLCKVDGFALWGEWGFMGVVASVGVEGFG